MRQYYFLWSLRRASGSFRFSLINLFSAADGKTRIYFENLAEKYCSNFKLQNFFSIIDIDWQNFLKRSYSSEVCAESKTEEFYPKKNRPIIFRSFLEKIVDNGIINNLGRSVRNINLLCFPSNIFFCRLKQKNSIQRAYIMKFQRKRTSKDSAIVPMRKGNRFQIWVRHFCAKRLHFLSIS